MNLIYIKNQENKDNIETINQYIYAKPYNEMTYRDKVSANFAKIKQEQENEK